MRPSGHANICNILFEKEKRKKEKKTLFGTSNRSKIFQSVFDIKQIHISTFWFIDWMDKITFKSYVIL